MAAEGPEAIHQLVTDAFNAKDVDALVALYEPEATMVTPEGPAVGHAAIRANWERLVSLDSRMELSTRYVVVNEDIALLRNDYRVASHGLELTGSTAEVVRRQPDGTWLYVIDHPFGAGNLHDA